MRALICRDEDAEPTFHVAELDADRRAVAVSLALDPIDTITVGIIEYVNSLLSDRDRLAAVEVLPLMLPAEGWLAEGFVILGNLDAPRPIETLQATRV